MKARELVFWYALSMGMGAIFAAACTAGCASCQAIEYAGELDQCVYSANTKAESQACRCDVARKHNRRCDNDSDATPTQFPPEDR